MNSEDLTLPLNEPLPDAPSTQPLLKEIVADVRELKAAVVALTELVQQLIQQVGRIEQRVEKIEQRLEGIEREQTLMRFGMDKMNANALRHEERISLLERQFDATQKIAA